MHTRSTLGLIWRYKWTLLAPVCASLVLAAGYMSRAVPVYEVRARLLLDPLQLPTDRARGIASSDDFAATQAQILGSPALVQAALQSTTPAEAEIRHVSVGATQRQSIGIARLLEVLESLRVKPVPRTDVLDLSFRSEDRRGALDIIESLISQYRAYLAQQHEQLLTVAQEESSELARLQQDLRKAMVVEAGLAHRYGPKHPEMRAAREGVALLQQALDEQMRAPLEIQQTAVGSPGQGIGIRVLEGPLVSEEPVWPAGWLIMPVALVGGLMIGGGLTAVASRCDDTLRSPADVETYLGLSTCGSIPKMSVGWGAYAAHRYLLKATRTSPATEAFSALARTVMATGTPGEGRIIQLTSAVAGAGKTTIAANLAVTLARLGKKVALVDGDLRRGVLHRSFNVSAGSGITSVFLQGAPVDDLLQVSPLAPIDVLTRGPSVGTPPDYLNQPEIEKILEVLRQEYDAVIVDTPSLLAVADASLLAPQVDMVLLILEADRTSATTARRALDMLESIGTRMVGIVLNRCPFCVSDSRAEAPPAAVDAAAWTGVDLQASAIAIPPCKVI